MPARRDACTGAPAAGVADDSHHPGRRAQPDGRDRLPGAGTWGDTIRLYQASRSPPGRPLLLIEAMKTFNQIKSPRAGTVSRILVSSGAPVEFGEVLLVLDP